MLSADLLQRRCSESAWTVANTDFLRRASARTYFGDVDCECVRLSKHRVLDLIKDLSRHRSTLVHDYAFYVDARLVDDGTDELEGVDKEDREEDRRVAAAYYGSDLDLEKGDDGRTPRAICIWRITNPRRHTWFRRLLRCGRHDTTATRHMMLCAPRDGHVVLEEAIPGIDFDVVHSLAEKKVHALAQKYSPCWVTVELI